MFYFIPTLEFLFYINYQSSYSLFKKFHLLHIIFANMENRSVDESLNSFIIDDQIIGKGHFSVVYKGSRLKDELSVAIKKVPLLEIVGENADLCMKEIDLLQQLNHPNIIRYLASFVENNDLYIVLELANGGDLLCMITNFKSRLNLIPENTIWKYFVQICSGLEHMHSKSIMHRDIKPANVLMMPNGIIKLSDLGLSRFFSSNTKVAQTVLGTPHYMSPERIQEKPYTFSSDIWSLGCLLYEMAALQSPFHSTSINLYILCKRIERCDYCPIPSDIYSKKMRKIIASCINADPDARPDISSLHKIAHKMNQVWSST